jgi:hypothetical protein
MRSRRFAFLLRSLAMPASVAWLVCSLVFAASPQSSEEVKSSGWQQWKQGQQCLQDGETDRAIDLFEESLANDPNLARNYVSLAAAWLDRNDEGKACLYLELYVAAHPEHVAIRFQFVELLQRLKRVGDARTELEHFIADMQEQDRPEEEHLIHCHSWLMQIAEKAEDEYEEHLHRGIGLFLLSKQRGSVSDDSDDCSPQSLLCRAAAELTLAARCRPDEARAHYYLHRVWSGLLQSQPARRSLRAADAAAPFSYLTPAEQRQLRMSCRQLDRDSGRR